MKNTKVIIVSILVLFVAILVVQNTEEVVTQIFFAEVRLPRAALLFATFAAGFASGALVTMRAKKTKPQTT